MAYISAINKTHNSIDVKIKDLSTDYAGGDRRVEWKLRGELDSDFFKKTTHIISGNTDSGTILSGLDSSTTYEIRAYIYDSNTNGHLATLDAEATTYPKTPQLEEVKLVHGGGIDVTFGYTEEDFDEMGILYGFQLSITETDSGATVINQIYECDYYSNEMTVGFINELFTVGTNYTCTAYGIKELSNGDFYYNTDYSTQNYFTYRKKPNAWWWEISNGRATAEQTQKACQALENKEETTNFSYLVWNDLVYRVWDFLEYTNMAIYPIRYAGINFLEEKISDGDLTADTTYEQLLISYCVMTEIYGRDKDMTALKFNVVKYCIDQMGGEILDDSERYYVKKGDIAYGSYFLRLAQRLNTIP